MSENDKLLPVEGEDYSPEHEDQVDERLAAMTDEETDARAASLRAGLEDYDLDEEDLALLAEWAGDDVADLYRKPAPVVAVVGRPNVGKSTLVNLSLIHI